jgi:hypothetical protein
MLLMDEEVQMDEGFLIDDTTCFKEMGLNDLGELRDV